MDDARTHIRAPDDDGLRLMLMALGHLIDAFGGVFVITPEMCRKMAAQCRAEEWMIDIVLPGGECADGAETDDENIYLRLLRNGHG